MVELAVVVVLPDEVVAVEDGVLAELRFKMQAINDNIVLTQCFAAVVDLAVSAS